MSKIGLVLEYMQKGKGITSLEAINMFGATRLSGIIYDLKEKGYEISGRMELVKDRFGNEVYVKRYFLIRKTKSSGFLDLIRKFM